MGTTSYTMPVYTVSAPVTTAVAPPITTAMAPPVYTSAPAPTMTYAAPASVSYVAPTTAYAQAAPTAMYAQSASVSYAAIQQPAPGPVAAYQPTAFDMIDTNHDGVISRQEMGAVMR